VITNLINNALLHAFDQRHNDGSAGTGCMRLSATVEAARVQIVFEDNGGGIAEQYLSRIFDPFFTTKAVGKGTGLGLSLAYSTVQKHHGRIDVRSTPGCGTTFRITLPVRQAQAVAP